jgi:hypothetical protein
VHEIKHDGYRLIVRRDGPSVRLFTHRGYDWTGRYPAIASAAAKLRARSFTLDGEAVVCGGDGVAVFDALHRRRHARRVILGAGGAHHSRHRETAEGAISLRPFRGLDQGQEPEQPSDAAGARGAVVAVVGLE